MKTKVFSNLKGIPDKSNVVQKRLSLTVDKNGKPTDTYWKKRLENGSIVAEQKANNSVKRVAKVKKQTIDDSAENKSANDESDNKAEVI